MAERQLRGHQPFGEQALRTVEICQHGIQQPRPLLQSGFDGAPLRGADHERQRIQGPGPVGALRVGVDVVRHAVFDDQPAGQLQSPSGSPARVVLSDLLDQPAPMGANRTAGVEQFVIAARVRNVGCQAPLRQYPGLGGSHLSGRRRSRVNGNSLLVACDGATILPGVWPILKNRARRLLSDSKALTGKVT